MVEQSFTSSCHRGTTRRPQISKRPNAQKNLAKTTWLDGHGSAENNRCYQTGQHNWTEAIDITSTLNLPQRHNNWRSAQNAKSYWRATRAQKSHQETHYNAVEERDPCDTVQARTDRLTRTNRNTPHSSNVIPMNQTPAVTVLAIALRNNVPYPHYALCFHSFPALILGGEGVPYAHAYQAAFTRWICRWGFRNTGKQGTCRKCTLGAKVADVGHMLWTRKRTEIQRKSSFRTGMLHVYNWDDVDRWIDDNSKNWSLLDFLIESNIRSFL